MAVLKPTGGHNPSKEHGPSPEELGPLLHSRSGRKLGEVNPEPKDPCAGGCRPPSTNRSGTGTTSVSNPWHLLHAMRAMRISSQEPPADSVESGEVQLGGEPPGKGEDNFGSRMWELIRKRQQYQQVRKPKVADCGVDKCCTEGSSEMQTMFPTPVITIDSLKERLKLSPNRRRNSLNPAASSVKLDPKTINGDVCLLTDSPFRILRAAESGNVEDFGRLYLAEPGRLGVRDSRGRAAAHQAAARNKLKILQFIATHGGGTTITNRAVYQYD